MPLAHTLRVMVHVLPCCPASDILANLEIYGITARAMRMRLNSINSSLYKRQLQYHFQTHQRLNPSQLPITNIKH